MPHHGSRLIGGTALPETADDIQTATIFLAHQFKVGGGGVFNGPVNLPPKPMLLIEDENLYAKFRQPRCRGHPRRAGTDYHSVIIASHTPSYFS